LYSSFPNDMADLLRQLVRQLRHLHKQVLQHLFIL